MNKNAIKRFICFTKIISEHWGYTLLTGTVLLILLLPLFILCFYAHPQALDNYLIFKTYEENGVDIFSKNIRPGCRFISYLFINPLWLIPESYTINDITTILTIYRIYAGLMIALFSLSFYYLLKMINTFYLNLSRSQFIFLYSLLLFLIINSLQCIDLFFYEMTTTTGYTIGLSFGFIYIGLLIKYYFTKKNLLIPISYVLVFLLCGTIEYFTILTGYIAFIFLLAHLIKKKEIKFFLILHIAYCLLSFYLFTLVPGAVEKIKGYSGGIQNPHSVIQFLKWFRNMNYELGSTFVYLLQRQFIPILLLIFVFIKHKIPAFNKYTVLFLIGNYGLCYIMASAIFILGVTDFIWVGYVIQIPHTLMIINTLFLLLIFMSYIQKNYTIVFTGIKNNYLKLFSYFNIVSVVCFLTYILSIGIFFKGLPVRQAWKDVLKGTAKNYNREVHKIYEEIQQSKEKIVSVQEITDIPLTLSTMNHKSNLWSTTGFYALDKTRYTNELAPFFYKEDIIITEKQIYK